MSVILETSLGDIVVDLYIKERPKCSTNFLKLCKIKYYNFCLFHSVQRNLVAQTGDPTGTGRGGGSVYEKLYGEQARYFDAEVKPRIKHLKRGTLSMVNNGAHRHGAQFFLTLAESIDYLDGEHTVFGEVAEGFEVLDQINEAYVDTENRPYKDIRIYHTVILDDPFDDPSGLSDLIPDRSPEPTKEQLDSGRIGAEEEIDKTKGKTLDEVDEMIKEKEAKANAQILEMVGDLPTADTEAPDSVLFVCKLNPLTSSEDLEVIFSRFGNILSCEVIKDHKTEESLQYAFIEFEKPEECENAYFKMDNVLIDDRRIHVDFSQSVSKLKYKNPKAKSDRAQIEIKDKSKKDGYDLVYSDEEEQRNKSLKKHKSKKSKHKHKKKHSNRDSSPEEHKSHRKSSNDQDQRNRNSRSPVAKRRARSRSRSRSRSRNRDRAKRDGSRDRKAMYSSDKRARSRSRDRYRKHRSMRDEYR